MPVRKAFRGPLLTALNCGRPAPGPGRGADERAALLPHFVDDLALLENLTGNSYADWAAIRPADVRV